MKGLAMVEVGTVDLQMMELEEINCMVRATDEEIAIYVALVNLAIYFLLC